MLLGAALGPWYDFLRPVKGVKRDLLFVMNADNQADKGVRHVIFHEYYRHFLPQVQDEPLPEDPQAHCALTESLGSRELISQYGEPTLDIAARVNGVRYIARENSLNITQFELQLERDGGTLLLEMDQKLHTLPFGLCCNEFAPFSFGQRCVADYMGKNEPGMYDCAISASWVDRTTFAIQAQVIDTYFGCLNVHISFKDSRATLQMQGSGQYVFDGIRGYAIGTAAQT